ncbi:MAG: DUF4336 domain-containing protein [Pseudohongiella sp.]|nr:DUF4336 domain-containing protein [Pseudohongiella sp.]MDP2128488.1 DUF4336 domain-containing protein [Pseudohongiella sp.]
MDFNMVSNSTSLETNVLETIVPDSIWHARQALKFGPISITTRMTVVRLRDGSLWVHSPVTPTPELIATLSNIGNVRCVIAPNKSHHLYFPAFLAAYPSAAGFIAPGLESKRPDLAGYPLIPDDAPWGDELQGFFIDGLPILNETVWFHAATGTLILTDLLFCFSQNNRGLSAFVAKVLGVYNRLAMSRTMKLAIKDKHALRRSVRPLLSLPCQRIIVAHDEIIGKQAAEKLKVALREL